jgi:hypothetical protein
MPQVLDNLVDWNLILTFRALLQANVDLHKLGETTTGAFSYEVFLWAVPICITLDLDVDMKPYHSSEWLQANIYLDILRPGDKCFHAGDRVKIRMSDMPKLGNLSFDDSDSD